jgi:hypothetical protein
MFGSHVARVMSNIPADTMSAVLELRKNNGLEATESGVLADLQKSKAKWTLEETPRYRRAGASPIWVSGKYLSSYGSCPATGEKDGGNGKAPRPAKDAAPKATSASNGKVDEAVFYKVLHGKGFPVKITQDLLTGEIQTTIPDSIKKLELQFGASPSNASGIHVTQTSPQIQVSMPLDRFLEIAGIRA